MAIPYPTTVEAFVEALLDAPSRDIPNETTRAALHKKGKISPSALRLLVKHFLGMSLKPCVEGSFNMLDLGESALSPCSPIEFQETIPFKNHSPANTDTIFVPFVSENLLSSEFIQELEKQLSWNVIRRNPWSTLALGLGLGVSAFAVPLTVLVILNALAVNAMSGVFAFLPFLVGLGPIGAALGFAGLMAAVVLVIFGVAAGMTAAVSTPTPIQIEEEEPCVQVDARSSQVSPRSAMSPLYLNKGGLARPPQEHYSFSTPHIDQLRRGQATSLDGLLDEEFQRSRTHSPAGLVASFNGNN